MKFKIEILTGNKQNINTPQIRNWKYKFKIQLYWFEGQLKTVKWNEFAIAKFYDFTIILNYNFFYTRENFQLVVQVGNFLYFAM